MNHSAHVFVNVNFELPIEVRKFFPNTRSQDMLKPLACKDGEDVVAHNFILAASSILLE